MFSSVYTEKPLSNESQGKDKVASSPEAIGYSCSKPIYNLDGSANLESSRRVSFRFVINQQ